VTLPAHGRNYVSVVYNEKDRPFTEYPDLLTQYLVKRFRLTKGQKILDLGCGRGDFLRGFIRCGLNGYGVDQFSAAAKICSGAEILQSDLEEKSLPYKPDSFNVIFSKSVLEHFYYPEKLVQEIFRIVKPGGLVITMVPDWASIYKTAFYDDYTHRTPFTIISLKNIFTINRFDDVKVEKFRQLPFLWERPWLGFVSTFMSLAAPDALRSRSKLVKFSKEVMLLCTAIKPNR